MTGPGMDAELVLTLCLLLDSAAIDPGPDALRKIQDLIDKQNGAQVLTTWTPPSPTADKEPRAMHTLPTENTPRGRQLISALALAHLLELDLPAAEWRITEAGKLCGHVQHVKDSTASGALHTYAGFLGAPIESKPGRNEHTSYVHLHVEAKYRGAQVTVWTHVDVRPTARTEVPS